MRGFGNFNIGIYVVVFSLLFSCSQGMKSQRFFVGKFTDEGQMGLQVLDLNPRNGTINFISEADAGPNPTYFCFSGDKGIIYAANEVMDFQGLHGGGITSLKYNPKTGTAEKIHEFPIPNGSPCYIALSPEKKHLLLANYSGSSVTVVKLDEEGIPVEITDSISFTGPDGKVSHPHMISFDPAGRRAYLTDLGLDRIVIYDFDNATGRLKEKPGGIVSLEEGSGPRHFVFSADGSMMYVINELNSSISVFQVDDAGGLTALQTFTTLRADFSGISYSADIHLSKNNNFLYGSNRGENTIVTFRINSDGLLNLAGHTNCGGDWPRNFALSPSGKYILVGNQRSGNISIFSIDEKTGLPAWPIADFSVGAPACIKFQQ